MINKDDYLAYIDRIAERAQERGEQFASAIPAHFARKAVRQAREDAASEFRRGQQSMINALRNADRQARWNAVQPDGRVDWDQYDHAFDACANYLESLAASATSAEIEPEPCGYPDRDLSTDQLLRCYKPKGHRDGHRLSLAASPTEGEEK